MFCNQCGGAVPDASRFCNHCGKALGVPSAPPADPPAYPSGPALYGVDPELNQVMANAGVPGFQVTIQQSGTGLPPPQPYGYPPVPIPPGPAPGPQPGWGAPTEIRPCAFCDGSGQHPMNFSQMCPVCGGTGKNQIVAGSAVCARCDGEGDEPFNLNQPCQVCGGRGFVLIR